MKYKNIVIILFIFIFIFLLNYFNNNDVSYTNTNTNTYFEYFSTQKTIILLGDSILNNQRYVPAQESIPYLLNQQYKLINLAQDNATISSVYSQLNKISIDLNNSNTFVFVSVGGNDIINNKQNINQIIENYNKLLETIKARLYNCNIIILNLYYPIESHDEYYNEINMWNNNIKNQSIKSIDLTNIIKTTNDLTAYIEPSSIGGEKIVSAIISNL
jgi:lysophospholipase L1-like esterase